MESLFKVLGFPFLAKTYVTKLWFRHTAPDLGSKETIYKGCRFARTAARSATGLARGVNGSCERGNTPTKDRLKARACSGLEVKRHGLDEFGIEECSLSS